MTDCGEAVHQSLQTCLYAQLEKAPERRAIGFVNPAGETAWRTREDIHGRAAAAGARLADLGLKQADVCILVLASDEVCATLLLSVLLLGAVPVLIAPPNTRGFHSYQMDALNHTIRKTKARVVICPESMRGMRKALQSIRRSTRFVFGAEDVFSSGSHKATRVAPREDDIAAMQLTSGTTGRPRLCVWKQKNVLASLGAMAVPMMLSPDDVCFNWTPLYHDLGLVNSFLLCLTSGVPLALLEPHEFAKRPALWLHGLWKTQATITFGANFGFAHTARKVRDDEIEGVRLDGVRAFWNAAERVHPETMWTFYKRFAPFGLCSKALKTTYGLAENIAGATFSDPEQGFIVEKVDRSTLQERRLARLVPDSEVDTPAVWVSGVGRPCPGIRITILSRTGQTLPEGHIGEVALETPSRMAGYLGDARATRRATYGKLLRTGDLGYLRGSELFWVGRGREGINVRGKQLDPSDFESALVNISGLRDGCFAAFGVDDAGRGTQRVVIVAEVTECTSRSHAEITNEIRNRVYRYLGVTVGDIVLVRKGTLTKTSSGKRRNRFFHKLYADHQLERFEVASTQNAPVSS